MHVCPGWRSCVLVGIALGVLLGLGTWQLQRAAYKRSLLEEFDAASRAAAVPLPVDAATDYARLRYHAVFVEGAYDGGHQFLLDNQVVNGRAGYHVLTPLRLRETPWAVLVDRGWVAQGQTRQLLPDVRVGASPRRVSGQVYVPLGTGYRLGSLDGGTPGWPRVVQYLDFPAMSERLGYALLPVVIRLEPAAEDGYLREWKTLGTGPERHVGYALQWFGLAAALVVIIVVVAMRGGAGRKDDQHEF